MSFPVLIAEDSAAMRALLVSAVEMVADTEVVEASSGFEALKQLPRRKFGLIITDINMPDINGLELINFVRNSDAYKDIPVIVVTTEGRDFDFWMVGTYWTEGRERDKEKGLALGANEYLIKPIDPDALADVVKRYVGGVVG